MGKSGKIAGVSDQLHGVERRQEYCAKQSYGNRTMDSNSHEEKNQGATGKDMEGFHRLTRALTTNLGGG